MLAERQGKKQQPQNEFERVELRLVAARRAMQAQRSSSAISLTAHPASIKPQNTTSLSLSPGPTSPPTLPFNCRPLEEAISSSSATQVMIMGTAFGQAPPLVHQPNQFGTRALNTIANAPLEAQISQEESDYAAVVREERRKTRNARRAKKAEPASSESGFLSMIQQAIMTPLNQITGFQDTSLKISRNEYSARVYSIRRGVDVESYFVDGVKNGTMNLRPLHEYLKDHRHIKEDIK